MLNDAFIDRVDWPKELPYLVFRVSAKLAPKRAPVRDMVSLKKYVCRTSYIVNKRESPLDMEDGRGYGLEIGPFKSFAEYRWVYTRTHNADFVKAFRAYNTPAYMAEFKEYLKDDFSKTKGVCVRCKGKVVAMLSLFKIGRHAWFSPLYWISWIWADQAQPREIRRAAHSMLRAWVRKNISGYVGASIHAANLRSQNWFIKLGARPCQIFFSRR